MLVNKELQKKGYFFYRYSLSNNKYGKCRILEFLDSQGHHLWLFFENGRRHFTYQESIKGFFCNYNNFNLESIITQMPAATIRLSA